jgi:anti-anti-sigma factor
MQGFDGAAVTVFLRGEFDISTRGSLRRQLAKAERADAAVIDLSGVTYAGTTLFNALIALKKSMRKHGGEGEIRLVGSSPHVRRLLTITCLDRVFEVA